MKLNKSQSLQLIAIILFLAILCSGIVWFIYSATTTHTEIPTKLFDEVETEVETETKTEEEIEIIFVPIEIETEAETEAETEVEVEVELVITYDYIKENYYFWSDAMLIAMVMTNECASVPSDTEQACVAWTILNRVDREGGIDVFSVVTAPSQFAWDENAVPSEHSYWLAEDVMIRWMYEKLTGEPLGRVLPNDYYYFYGDNYHNYFYQVYTEPDNVWNYSLESPYES